MANAYPNQYGDVFLCGWKMIEDWLGLTRNTIIARGYPVRRAGRGCPVIARKDQLHDHTTWIIKSKPPKVKREMTRRRRTALAHALRARKSRGRISVPGLKRSGLFAGRRGMSREIFTR